MKLYQVLEKQCTKASANCEISLEDVTDFGWDQVVFIRMQATETEFTNVTGIESVTLPEFDELVLFYKNGVEVFRDARTYNPEKGFNGTYFLNFEREKAHVKIFDRVTAKFALEKVEIGNYSNIYLRPI